DVQGLVLLCVIAEAKPVARDDNAGVGIVQAGQDTQQRGLSGTVEAEHDDVAAFVDGEINIGEYLERSIALAEVRRGKRGLSAGRWIRELDLGYSVAGALSISLGQQPLGSPDHVVRGHGFGRLG